MATAFSSPWSLGGGTADQLLQPGDSSEIDGTSTSEISSWPPRSRPAGAAGRTRRSCPAFARFGGIDGTQRLPIPLGSACAQEDSSRVPSRFVNFPDEGHWVLKPKNGERWHQEVFGWLEKYVPPRGGERGR